MLDMMALGAAVMLTFGAADEGTRVLSLVKAVGYDRKLPASGPPLGVAVVGSEQGRQKVLAAVATWPAVKGRAVTLDPCEEVDCLEGSSAKMVLVAGGLDGDELASLFEVAAKLKLYTLSLNDVPGVMICVNPEGQLGVDSDALAEGQVELEPSILARARRVPPRVIQLPEEASPPEELPDNQRPEFPADARAKGAEGEVVLKLAVLRDGSVGAIEVMKGDPMFATPTVATARTWRFKPAKLGARTIAVFKVVKIPFRLR